MSKQVKAGVILQFLNNTLDLYYLFQRTLKEKKDLLQFYQKSHFESFFTTNYGKLGLATYLGEIYLHPSTISQKDLVIDLFGTIPFITQCYLQNGKIMLYIVLPNEAQPIFRDYLEKLHYVHLITHFSILPLKSYDSIFSLNRSQNKNAYISSFLPFNGRFWFLFNRPYQKMPDLIDKYYKEFIDYSPSKVEIFISPLHLLLLLSKREIFQNLYQFSNMRDFLSNAKKIISFKVKVKNIPPKIQITNKFSETFAFYIDIGFFNQFDDFSIAKSHLETWQEPHGPFQDFNPSSFPTTPLKFLKLGKKIIDYAYLCKYPSPASLENYSSGEFFGEITHILSELRNRNQYSQHVLKTKINQLFSSQILQENRGAQIHQFYSSEPRYFMIQIRSKRLKWLESILFSNFLSIFNGGNGNVYNYQILLSTDYWRVFIRFLTLTPIDLVESLPSSPIPTPTHDLLYFFSFSNQKWDLHKFSLSNKCNQILRLVDKYLPSNPRKFPFYPVHDEKVANLFPPFSLPKFMKGVFRLRKDNEIAQKLISLSAQFFKFLQNSFLSPSFNMDSCKSFIRENYIYEFPQIQRILAIIPKQRSESQSDLEMGRYLLIIQNYLFPCHPRVLLHDRLLKGLFCPGLRHVFFFGGIKEGVLVLEYIFPKSLASSPEFKLQYLLNRIEQKYLLQLRLQSVTEEYRFVSPEFTPSAPLEIKQYQHITLKKTEQHIAHPSFVHIPQTTTNLRTTRDIPDAFWQVVGHPVTLFIHISCSVTMKIPLVNMLMQLPIGQIFVSDGDSKPFTVELVAWIHLAEAINYALYQLFEILDQEEVRYFISPILDYSIINDPNLKLPIEFP